LQEHKQRMMLQVVGILMPFLAFWMAYNHSKAQNMLKIMLEDVIIVKGVKNHVGQPLKLLMLLHIFMCCQFNVMLIMGSCVLNDSYDFLVIQIKSSFNLILGFNSSKNFWA
jgi:hypothetical protein